MNDVLILGRVTKDAELRYTNGGVPVMGCRIAWNPPRPRDGQGPEPEATFVDVSLFGQDAPVAAQQCRKGVEVFVKGQLKAERWQDAQTGQPREKLAIEASKWPYGGVGVFFRGERQQGAPSQGAPAQQGQGYAPRPAGPGYGQPAAPGYGQPTAYPQQPQPGYGQPTAPGYGQAPPQPAGAPAGPLFGA